MKKLFSLLSVVAVLSVSCVPARLYNEMKAKKANCAVENDSLKAQNLQLTTHNNELSYQNDDLKSKVEGLAADTASLSTELRNLKAQYNEVNANYQQLLKDGPNGAANSEATKKLIRDLQKTQENLQQREDEIIAKEKLLKEKKENLDRLSAEMKAKDARLEELEHILAAKDSSAKALKNTLVNALSGYADKGLSVEMKNGKVYVMLEERLLFATGSIVVDAKGVDALKDLAKVLEKNPDINILIEGHTDNVPMKGTGDMKDNWDLSVMRATSVVKIITSNSKVSPTRLTAAGRGEFIPLDKSNTVEGRKKNRRIEVILTPKLDEILKVLETN
ncbi:MAG TPA: OmpA family protein [Bacteroidia bacterium]|jgi:chemotaxis protein MotB|nr:OmpA family protein [Bacteroidia bacterium]HQF27714.1 OmpA family protein [Bacteroidia bacterium]HQK97749.1 OmpA family protein [Bacteroidia bacterium]